VAAVRDIPPGFLAAGCVTPCVTRWRRWCLEERCVFARREISKVLKFLMIQAIAPIVMVVSTTTRLSAVI
jgi:hypothetical protein